LSFVFCVLHTGVRVHCRWAAAVQRNNNNNNNKRTGEEKSGGSKRPVVIAYMCLFILFLYRYIASRRDGRTRVNTTCRSTVASRSYRVSDISATRDKSRRARRHSVNGKQTVCPPRTLRRDAFVRRSPFIFRLWPAARADTTRRRTLEITAAQ